MKMNLGGIHIPTIVLAVLAFLVVLGLYHIATKK